MMCWKYLPGGTGKKDAMMEGRQSTAKGGDSIWCKIWKENHKTFPPIRRNFIFFFYQLYISNLFNFLLQALNFCYLLATKTFSPLMCRISSINTKNDMVCSSPGVQEYRDCFPRSLTRRIWANNPSNKRIFQD